MYWFRSDAGPGWLILAVLVAVWTLGGQLLIASGFRLRRREQLLAGLALGLVLSIWLANLLGHWLPPNAAFWVASLAIPVTGLALTLSKGRVPSRQAWMSGWPAVAIALALAIMFVLMGRGLGILDDRKNLSFISVLAAGDIPPRFYMNPEVAPTYHYGFQLLGAMLMRLAGLFPWSAFDLAKGIAAGTAVGLAGLVGWRLTYRPAGGVLAAALLCLASGGRWLLLFLPQSLLRSISADVELWGSAATSAANLYDGLAGSWILEGGPPVPIPFAFVNGILQPFVLGSQAGPGVLSLVILLLVVLLMPRARGWIGAAVLVPLVACWALVSEADFGLFAVGLLAVAAIATSWKPGPPWRSSLRRSLTVLGIALVIALFQGGTLTDLRHELFDAGGNLAGSAELAGLSLAWPPAIVSAHLGELELLNPRLLLLGVLELGPALLAVPVAVWLTQRLVVRGRFALAGWGAASLVGVLLPLVVRYESERDITRLAAFGLLGCTMLGSAYVVVWCRARPSPTLRLSFGAWLGAICFAGLVVSGSLMTAIPRATLSSDIAPIDAQMADRFWGRLEPAALILDSHPWRGVAVTGLPTKSSPGSLSTLPEWEELIAVPSLDSVLDFGFRYVYVDELWWQRFGGSSGAFLSHPCAELLGTERDEGANGSRRLFDLSACRSP